MRQPLYSRLAISLILILQIIPLVLFPLEVFEPESQQWWLPALLVLMVVLGDIQLLLRRSFTLAPWYLLAFAQGFNIISRLMMVWANGATMQGRVVTLHPDYIVLTVVAIALSTWLLLYMEKPQVREGLLPA